MLWTETSGDEILEMFDEKSGSLESNELLGQDTHLSKLGTDTLVQLAHFCDKSDTRQQNTMVSIL